MIEKQDGVGVELHDQKTAWDRTRELIQGSRKRIELFAFLIRDDPLGQEVLRNLEASVAEVLIFKDPNGGLHELTEGNQQPILPVDLGVRLKAFIYGLTKKQISGFIPAATSSVAFYITPNNCPMDHSKTWEFDGEILGVSDMNVGEEYKEWDGYTVFIHSETFVTKVNACIRAKYFIPFAGSRGVTPIFDFPGFNRDIRIPTEFLKADIPYQMMDGTPVEASRIAELELRERDEAYGAHEVNESLILMAKHKIRIHSGYLDNPAIFFAILLVLTRGVQVEILSTKNPNIYKVQTFLSLKKLITRAAELGASDKLRIYLRENMVHAKALQIDEDYLHINSANLDRISGFLSAETGVVVGPDYPEIQAHFGRMFEEKKTECERISAEELTGFLTMKKVSDLLRLIRDKVFIAGLADKTCRSFPDRDKYIRSQPQEVPSLPIDEPKTVRVFGRDYPACLNPKHRLKQLSYK